MNKVLVRLQHFRLLCNTVFIPASLLSSLSAMRMYLIAAGSAVITNYESRITNYELRITNYELLNKATSSHEFLAYRRRTSQCSAYVRSVYLVAAA